MIERINGELGTPAGGFDDYRVTVNSDGLAESGVSVQVAPITGAWIETVALLVRSCCRKRQSAFVDVERIRTEPELFMWVSDPSESVGPFLALHR
jgi:hypothetical protein